MSEAKQLILYGDPVGKGRPRFAKRGGHVQAYTPEKTVEYEDRLKAAWVETHGNFGFPEKVPLCMVVLAYVKPAESLSKKRRQALLGTPCLKKPDADNIAKIVMDGLQGVAFPDDAAVYCVSSTKIYDETPRIEVAIWEVE